MGCTQSHQPPEQISAKLSSAKKLNKDEKLLCNIEIEPLQRPENIISFVINQSCVEHGSITLLQLGIEAYDESL